MGNQYLGTHRGQKLIIPSKRRDKALSLQQAAAFASNVTRKLSSQDVFFLGIGIYIGEGSKTCNVTRIVNADPRIITFSITWFMKCFGLSKANFKLRLHIYPDTDQGETLGYWLQQTGLGKDSFQGFSVDTRDKKPQKRKILPYGTAHLTVIANGDKNFGVLLHRKILATIDCVLTKRD